MKTHLLIRSLSFNKNFSLSSSATFTSRSTRNKCVAVTHAWRPPCNTFSTISRKRWTHCGAQIQKSEGCSLISTLRHCQYSATAISFRRTSSFSRSWISSTPMSRRAIRVLFSFTNNGGILFAVVRSSLHTGLISHDRYEWTKKYRSFHP